MKYRIDNSHREFYSQNGWIELEDLLTPEDLIAINQGVDEVLAKREKVSLDRLQRLGSQSLFLAGRDIWRENAGLKKWICGRRLSEFAAEIAGTRPLRLAFDQVYTYVPGSTRLGDSCPPSGSLKALTSFQGLVCGLIICLKCAPDAPPSFFPIKPGNGLCFSPDLDLNIEQIYRGPEQRYLLIGYGKPVTLFIHQSQDQHAKALKELGYHYGDRLLDSIHPIVIR